MGMPIVLEIVDPIRKEIFEEVFSYFKYVDRKFSIYKVNSEITAINNGKLKINKFSKDMKIVFRLSEETKKETGGYFDIFHNGKYDPSGLVKGWAIFNAAKILKKKGNRNFYISAGGDIQVSGKNGHGKLWTIGIRNPFKQDEIIKTVALKNGGIATSGNYIRGNHVYNPKKGNQQLDNIVSITVVGPNVYEADRFATAAFAMGKEGINFIEHLRGFEGYMIDKNGIATLTSEFERYTIKL